MARGLAGLCWETGTFAIGNQIAKELDGWGNCESFS